MEPMEFETLFFLVNAINTEQDGMRIGFIGAGQMAQALAKGISATDPSSTISASDPNSDTCRVFANLIPSAIIRPTNLEVFASADLVFLAVKPQRVAAAFAGIDLSRANVVLISIVAGLKTDRLVQMIGNPRVIRVMPNTPSLIGMGAIAIARSENVSATDFQSAVHLLSAVGQVVEVTEAQLDAVTGLSGSGPAYVLEFLEAMIDGGVKMGLPREIAKTLSVQTILGTIQMLKAHSGHSSELKDQVTSPGGTTIYGLHELSVRQFKAAVVSAIQSATERARDLGNSQ